MRLADRTVTLQAPQEFLNLVQRWCDGATTMAQIRALAQRHWSARHAGKRNGDGTSDAEAQEFMAFVDALAHAGVVVDAGQALLHAQALANNPNDWGMPLAEALSVPAPSSRPAILGEGNDGEKYVQLGHVDSTRATHWRGLASQRRSCYAFSHETLACDELLALLSAYAPLVQGEEAEDGFTHRATASGGGLYQLQLHLVLLRAVNAQLPAGVYRVAYSQGGEVALHGLRTDAAVLPLAYRACLCPEVLDGATAWLVVAGDLHAIAAKYRNRAVSHAQIEAGLVLQNVALIAAERRLGQLPLAAFDDGRVAALCNLQHKTPLVTVVLGKPQIPPIGFKLRHEDYCAVRWAQTLEGLPYELAISRDRRETIKGKEPDYCFGRDNDPLVAYQKARCEVIERSLMRNAPPGLRWERWDTLTKTQHSMLRAAVHPHQVLRFSPLQYAAWGATALLAPFDETALYPWIAMQGLNSDTSCWMLADLLVSRKTVLSHTFPAQGGGAVGQRYAYATSSGCAASPSKAHALQNALLELVERDAFMRLWLQRTGAWELPARLLDATTQATVQRLRNEGGQVVFLELQSAFAQVVLCMAQFASRSFTLCGAGAHWDLAKAARKALGEVATGSLARLAGVQTAPLRPEDVRKPADHLHLYCQPEYFRRADFLFGFGPASTASITERKPQSYPELLDALRKAGMAAYASWLDAPEMPLDYKGRAIHAVRVIAPGLVPITFGHGLMPWVPQLRLVPDYNAFAHPFP
ncbi:MAG TPA: YcaO-like family protein [Burkholderiaceae bacterium]|nr:YcaO-like family protein [Burkholderiaceae bacterium]